MRPDRESGFALPSVLMLVVVLSLVALSVLLMQHLRYLNTLRDVACLKAEYAAQSGIALAASEHGFRGEETHLQFGDSSSATIRTLPWGLMKLALVRGHSASITAARVALLGAKPPPEYKLAFFMGNASRQLILTGSAEITGDLGLGPRGASVGTLAGERQPSRLPVVGRILKNPGLRLGLVDRQALVDYLSPFESFLRGELPANQVNSGQVTPIEDTGGGSASDSAATLVLSGDIEFTESISRREIPLTIYIQGDLTITRPARIDGTVAFYVTGNARIERGAMIEDAVIMCRDSITVEEGVTMRGQLIAPEITINSNSTLSYPSIVCSHEFGRSNSRRITLASGVRIEGLVAMFRGGSSANSNSQSPQKLVLLDRDAEVVGALYSEEVVTLDGKVTGSVLADDLYFYQAPTSYFGWLRWARIDRMNLPDGYAVPQAMGSGTGEVVLWF